MPAVLIATAKPRPDREDAFTLWLTRHKQVVSAFPGYISCDNIPPTQPDDSEWTTLLNFQTAELLAQWQQSQERAGLFAELLPLITGGNFGEIMPGENSSGQPATNVTQVILSKLKPGSEASYRAWSARTQTAQAKYPGYHGMHLQPPSSGPDGHWTSLLRFDTQEHLEAWLAAPERAGLMREAKAFIEKEDLMRLSTSFPGWVPMPQTEGKAPPDWKVALLVLPGLFPIVMLELRYLNPILDALHLNSSLAIFLCNVISVSLTSLVTIPFFVRRFGWWLFLKDDAPKRTTLSGIAILTLIFILEIALFWHLLP